MKSTIIIDKSGVNNLLALSQTKFNIHYQSSPDIQIINGEIKSLNFDYFIYSDSYENKFIMEELLSNRFIDMSRLPKYLQMYNLVNYGINVPNFIKNISNDNSVNDPNIIHEMSMNIKTEKIVIKHDHGARSLGQAIIDKNDISKFMYIINDNIDNSEKLKKLKGIYEPIGNHNNDNELYFFLDQFKSIKDFTIQEYISDIKEEYRLLLFYDGTVILFKREMFNSIEKENGGQEVNTEDYPILYECIKNLKLLFNDSKYLWMSADIYITSSDIVGSFEYSSQFGYRNSNDPEKIVNAMNNSLLQYISQHHKEYYQNQ